MARLRALPPRLKAAPSRFPSIPKQTAPHYSTPEHKAWARTVKERAGWKCEGLEHDARQPRAGVMLYADHVHELRDEGAALDPANGRALCASCHGLKTAKARAARLSP